MTVEKFNEMRRRIDEMRAHCVVPGDEVDSKDEGVRGGGRGTRRKLAYIIKPAS